MRYEWAAGSHLKGDPAVIGQHLEGLRESHGGELQKADIVKDARRKRSPLHVYFEWDDAVAAEAHRLEQARYLIRHVVVRREDDPEAKPVRAFVKILNEDVGFYTSIEHAMSEADMRDQVLARAKKDFLDLERKYQDLQEFAAVFDEIRKAVA